MILYLNKVLRLLGLQLDRCEKKIQNGDILKYREKYNSYYKLAERNTRGFAVLRDFRYERRDPRKRMSDIHCNFTSHHIFRTGSEKILDVGSWRLYIIGLLSYYDVTTIDFRERVSQLENETIITNDARALDLQDNSFDAVVSLAAFTHFGLGRYGDEFDLDCDIKAVNEMVRVLKPGGVLIFNTLITRSEPTILFNRCRVYNLEMIRRLCENLECIDEQFASHQLRRICSYEELTEDSQHFDSYLGCWKKV